MANRRLIGGVLGGPSLLRPSLTDDPVNELFWVHIDRVEIARLTAGVPPEIVSRLGLDNFLALEFQPPNVSERGEGGADLERENEDPDGNPDHEDLDWASIVRKDWESEISFLQMHWWTDKYEGKSRTCFGQTMTQFLMHMGIIQAGQPEDGAPAVAVPEEEDPSDHISDGDTEMLEQGGSEGTGGWDTSDFDTLDVGLGRRTLENTSSTGRAQTHEAGPSSSYQGVRADARPPAIPRREQEPTTSAEWMQSIRQISAARPEPTEELEQTASGTDTGGGSSTGRRWQQTDEGEDDDDDTGQTSVRSPGASAQQAQGHPGEGGDQNQSTSSPASGTLPADVVGMVDPNRSKGKTVDIPSRSSPGTRVHVPEAGEGSAFDLGLLQWEAATILADISRGEMGAEKRKRIVESSESDMDSPKRLKEYVKSQIKLISLSLPLSVGAEYVGEYGEARGDFRVPHEAGGEPGENDSGLDSLMKTKGRDGLAEILKEALDFLMKHKGREGLEDNLRTGVNSAKDASASDEQRHASSEGTPQPGPSAGTAENFAEAARNYCARLQAAEREFRDHFNRNVLPKAEAMVTGVHMIELDMHAAYRQTRMVHKERWLEFARYGSAYFAMRSIPTPDLERMILENRAEKYIKGFQFYDPLLCDNYDHGHLCDHGCVRIDCHICRVCAPAATTARSEKQVYKRAGLDQKGEEIFRCWGFGVREERDLRNPMDPSSRYMPNIWKPPAAMAEDGGDGMSAREDYTVPDGVERA
ncbi:hypothetical protein R1sor_010778 [Riccia sorocarpa]|uniref:Uncharacterized protein n=1 Tax=Riccia sorocarpa TaxID=122646 RepID=A0ABD3I2P1_9MARC